MKTKVFERLKPKAASFGFNDDELKTAAEYIAGSLAAEATDEMIDAAIDQFAPILGLSQKASQRSFSNLKAQFEKDHPVPPTPQPAPAPQPAPTPAPQNTPTEEIPAWFKTYQEQRDKEAADLKAKLEKMEKDKANEGFSSRALAGLKDVDEKYYGLMLKGREFQSNEEVDAFVGEVKSGWDELCKARNITAQSEITPPGGGAPGSTDPSQAIKDRIAARESAAAVQNNVIRGLAKPM